MEIESTEALTTRIEVLKRQAKKHQLFREKLPEAVKIAEAGLLTIQVAQRVQDVEEQKTMLVDAATSLARAKRLCREVSRGK